MKQQCRCKMKVRVEAGFLEGPVGRQSRKGACRFEAQRLVRSRILTDGKWTPACRLHLQYLESREPDAITRPLKGEPLNDAPLLPRGSGSACELFCQSAIVGFFA